MAFKFNPFTGKLDRVGSGSTVSSPSPTYAQFPKMVRVYAGGNFTIEKGGAARIFCADLAQGFTVLKSILINFGGSMSIQANSKGTVLGA